MTIHRRIWRDGDWLEPAAETAVSTDDRSFLLGDGCFETLYFGEHGLEGAAAHVSLLLRAAQTLGIAGGPSADAILTGLRRAGDALRSATVLPSQGVVRVTLSRGSGGRGADARAASPVMAVTADILPQGRPFAPMTIATSSVRRNETSPLSRIKSTSYGDNLAARREAAEAGADEALMLNTRGRLACLAMANVMLARPEGDGWRFVTPPVEEGARPGYMRGLAMQMADAAGWPCEERPVEAREASDAGWFLFGLNSLWGARPVRSLDGTERNWADFPLGVSGRAGPTGRD